MTPASSYNKRSFGYQYTKSSISAVVDAAYVYTRVNPKPAIVTYDA